MGNEQGNDELKPNPQITPADEGRPELDVGMLPGEHDPTKDEYDEDDWLRDLPD